MQNTKYDIIEQTGEETDVLSLRTNERVCVFDCAHRRKNYEKIIYPILVVHGPFNRAELVVDEQFDR